MRLALRWYDRAMEHDARAWRPQAFGRSAARNVRDPLVEPGWDGTRVLVHIGERPRVRIIDVDGLDITAHSGQVPAALEAAIMTDAAIIDGYLTFQATRSGVSTLPDSDVPQTMGGHMARFMLGGAADLISNPRADRWGRARGVTAVGDGAGDRAANGDAPAPVEDAAGDPELAPTAGAAGDGSGEPEPALAFVAVDLLEVDETPLLDIPLLERKRVLESIVEENLLVRRTPFVREPAATFIISWRAAGFEELVYKDPNSRYTPGAPNDGWALAPMPRR
jgi:hypothetical protein